MPPISNLGGGKAFYDWKRFHATKLPHPPLGRVASICLAIMDREGREVRLAEFEREAAAARLSTSNQAFRDLRNWYRAANEEQRADFRIELAADEARREANPINKGSVARIHATCALILQETGREPTQAELVRLLPT